MAADFSIVPGSLSFFKKVFLQKKAEKKVESRKLAGSLIRPEEIRGFSQNPQLSHGPAGGGMGAGGGMAGTGGRGMAGRPAGQRFAIRLQQEVPRCHLRIHARDSPH